MRILTIILCMILMATPAFASPIPTTYPYMATWEHLPVPIEDVPAVHEAITVWNDFAGVELFVLTNVDPLITWEQGRGAAVRNREDAYITDCRVRTPNQPDSPDPVIVYESSLSVMVHELGHCLGFPDIKDSMDFQFYSCLPESQHYIPYDGIMSYCDNMVLNEDDYQTLVSWGYVQPNHIWQPHPWGERQS